MSINPALYNEMAEQLQPAPAPAPAAVPTPTPTLVPEGQSFRIKRTGARPMKFAGTSLATEMSYSPGTSLWYELAVYRTTDRRFVLDVRMYTKSEDERDQFRAEVFSSVQELEEFLEGYETSADIDPSFAHLDTADLPVAELAVNAARLRLRIEEARTQFDDLAGQILYQLDGMQL